jgi:membrane protease YdiL (CAAX protease family)
VYRLNKVTPEDLHLHSSSRLREITHWDCCQDEKYGRSKQAGAKYLFFLLSVLYIPVTLLWSGLIPLEYRFHVSFLVIVSSLLFALQRRYQFRELGYRLDNFSSSLYWNFIFCLLGMLCLYFAYRYGLKNPVTNENKSIYVFYILFLAPAQELLYRGILFAEMQRMRNVDNRLILLVSTSSFCFLHLIYNHPPLIIISFVSGLIWGLIFMKCPNIWGVSLSHALLGATAIFLGVI